ncbi:MAG TPA: NADH-quinone oxidoreductase subunit C [bacterium]|nr:NADH-quinone oxidoreductase subunit C [bacterium]HPG45702.1 NADH-quinone oxidoreductase subunit C [bacterium]HPM97519.1 NADH-quinone oxidoreductase subunit C [bacterium]
MNWLKIKNLQAVPLSHIPRLATDELVENMLDQIHTGKRLVQFFANQSGKDLALYTVLADDADSFLVLAAAEVPRSKSFASMTPSAPACHLFEREIYEDYGIMPAGHPWLKPVRKGIAGIEGGEESYHFFHMAGEEVHEVGVGPIHAGVIEPGHFRFSCTGETVHHLEIELGFQHRGIEKLFIKNRRKPFFLLKLAESIAGDTVIGHTGAFVNALEALSGTRVPLRAESIRAIALELERVAVHLGDLSALSGDVAYLTGHSVFAALRTLATNTSLAICGNRFGRGLLAPGGVYSELTVDVVAKIKSVVDELEEKTELAADVLFASASVLSRFEKTGAVSKKTARELGMVGPAARASGIPIDARADFPYGVYASFPVHAFSLSTGDVFARAYVRYVEILQSLRMIREQVESLPNGKIRRPVTDLRPDHLVVSLTEGWRGEIAHIAITDKRGQLCRYKIKDPSFNNWLALALAVRNEGISDFPLCNKSFNLSYCGFDL